MTQGKKHKPILQMETDKMIPRHVYDKPFIVRFPHRSEQQEGFQPDRKVGRVCYADGSKANKGTEAGVYDYVTSQNLCFSLGIYTTAFQAEVYAIKAWAVKNLDRDYRNIYNVPDRQVAIKALGLLPDQLKILCD